ncbi:MAG: M16 family metallopeptidase [Caulobacterales bacterium]
MGRTLSFRAFARTVALTLALGGSFAVSGVFAPSSAYAQTAPESFVLRNGMQVVVITDRRAPVVTHMVWYRVGSADEARGESGIAHFLEHLMFKGTRRVAPGEFDAIITRNGGDHNAFTSYDYTAYYQRIARDRLELVMGLEADRMQNLRLLEEDVLSERDVIIEERRQRTDNNPAAVLQERMRAMLYPHHPYGTPVIGWLHEMGQLSRQDAFDFYHTWYTPNNAILVVAGDIDAAELRPLAERIYGRLRPNRNLPERVWVTDPPAIGAMRVTHSDPKVRQPSFRRFYPSTSYTLAEGREAHALDVAIEVLGGSETSRLYRALVQEQGIAVSAGAFSDTSGIGGGSVGITATPAEGVTPETLEAAVDAIVAQFLAEGPTQAETVRARQSLAASAIYARDSQESLANWIGSSLAEGETLQEIMAWADNMRAVTPEEAAAIARQTLRVDNSVTGWLMPSQSADGEQSQ